jgi:hypothetical protein
MAEVLPNGRHSHANPKPDSRGMACKAVKSGKLLILFAIAAAAAGGLGVFIGMRCHGPGFGLNFANAMLALSSGLILGGAVKLLLDSYQESQKQRDEQYDLRERLLEDLRNVYLRVECARLMVKAYNVAAAYGEQMSDLIGCQAVLLKVKRSLDLRLDQKDAEENAECFADIVGYLRALQNEFAASYNKIVASKNDWDLMSCQSNLPVLYDLTRCGDHFSCKLVGPLGRLAARLLEKGIPVLAKDVSKRAEGIPELDRNFNTMVENRAEKIMDDCSNAVSEDGDRGDQKATCPLTTTTVSPPNDQL